MTVENNAKTTEIYSLYSVFIIGMKWKQEVEVWQKPGWGSEVKNHSKVTQGMEEADIQDSGFVSERPTPLSRFASSCGSRASGR